MSGPGDAPGSAEPAPDAPRPRGPAGGPAGRVAAAALVGWLAWSALGGARDVAAELRVPAGRWRDALVLDEEARIERWLALNEERYGFRRGWPVELLRAVREHTGPDAHVSAVGSLRERAAGVLPLLQALCYPRLFDALAAVPPGWPRSAADYDPREHVLFHGGAAATDPGPAFERLAGGADWALWRCREGPP